MIVVPYKLSYQPRDWHQSIQPGRHALVFTGNSYVNRAGDLVMGRGAAQEVRDTYPGIAKAFGTTTRHLGFYGLQNKFADNHGLVTPMYAFQVKYNWADQAQTHLIQQSGWLLKACLENSPGWTFHMNFPGVGNGKLGFKEVMDVLEPFRFSDNLRLYYVQP